jgi:adenine-specific DNA-methyltransferase
MTYSHVLQLAYVVAQRTPSFAALRARDPDLRRALRSRTLRQQAAARGGAPIHAVAEYLARWVEAEPGFITAQFSPAGQAGRMYFTEENARRIDTIRRLLYEWHSAGLLDDGGNALLLAALIEGADRVANTAGVYTAYLKKWQPNAKHAINIEPVEPARGRRGSAAFREDAAAVASRLGRLDLLYVDPPYNARQYPGYYHVPEIIARGWFDAQPVLHGKTGLLRDGTQRSAWCSPRTVARSLSELLQSTSARHVLVSYNSEGLLAAERLEAILAAHSVDGAVNSFRQGYRRYRADSNRVGRQYKADSVRELLYHARLR